MSNMWSIPAVYVLVAWIIRELGSIGVQFIKGRTEARVAAIHVHDKDKYSAYSELMALAKQLRNTAVPPNDQKAKDFEHIMSQQYENRVFQHYPYYSEKITRHLDKLESRYMILVSGHAEREDIIHVHTYLEEQLAFHSNELLKLAKNESKKW